MQQQNLFEGLYAIDLLLDEDKCDFIRLTLRAGALAFYDDATGTSFLSYTGLSLACSSKNDSPTRREEHRKRLAA